MEMTQNKFDEQYISGDGTTMTREHTGNDYEPGGCPWVLCDPEGKEIDRSVFRDHLAEKHDLQLYYWEKEIS